jgi:hypothetical protein
MEFVTSLYITLNQVVIMKMNKKIPWGLATGTLGVTLVGIFNGTTALGMASIVGGALALMMALLANQQIEKKKLKPALMLELR